jgi:hypothetical protein
MITTVLFGDVINDLLYFPVVELNSRTLTLTQALTLPFMKKI